MVIIITFYILGETITGYPVSLIWGGIENISQIIEAIKRKKAELEKYEAKLMDIYKENSEKELFFVNATGEGEESEWHFNTLIFVKKRPQMSPKVTQMATKWHPNGNFQPILGVILL